MAQKRALRPHCCPTVLRPISRQLYQYYGVFLLKSGPHTGKPIALLVAQALHAGFFPKSSTPRKPSPKGFPCISLFAVSNHAATRDYENNFPENLIRASRVFELPRGTLHPFAAPMELGNPQ